MQKLRGVFRSGERLAALLDLAAVLGTDERSGKSLSNRRGYKREGSGGRRCGPFPASAGGCAGVVPGVEVVGSAANGKFALQKVRDLKPDLLTLDIEMPEMDGLAVLDALRQSGEPEVEVIVVSALSRRGGDMTMRALEKGAFDFITKPEAANSEEGRQALVQELGPRISAVAHRLEVRTILARQFFLHSARSSLAQPRLRAHLG